MAAPSTMTLSSAPSVEKLRNDEPIVGKFAQPVIKTKFSAYISPEKGVKSHWATRSFGAFATSATIASTLRTSSMVLYVVKTQLHVSTGPGLRLSDRSSRLRLRWKVEELIKSV